MTFTKEQMEALSTFEDNFRTATQSKYSRGIGTSGYTTMHRILKEATGIELPFRPSCYSCMFRLVVTTAKYYFADLDEMMQEPERIVETMATDEKPKKAVVKTRKPRAKKSE